jgi:hypothetical protein
MTTTFLEILELIVIQLYLFLIVVYIKNNQMKFQIAIPTFNRSIEIKRKTLRLLNSYNIPKEQITLFVANQDQYELYKHLNYKTVIGKLGITNQRIFISQYYPEGTHLLCLDDDIEQISTLSKEDKIIPLPDLSKFVTDAFETIIREKIHLWGVYPVHNCFYMSHTVKTGLLFCIGCMFGIIVRHDKSLLPNPISEGKEDYEQSILYFLKDKAVLRFNDISIKTKFKAIGGLGTENRTMMNLIAKKYLLETYPYFVKSNKNKPEEITLKYIPKTDSIIKLLPKVSKQSFDKLNAMLDDIKIPYKSQGSSRHGFEKHRAMTIGKTRARFSGKIGMSQNSIKHSDIHDEIYRIGLLICPF